MIATSSSNPCRSTTVSSSSGAGAPIDGGHDADGV